MDLKDRKFWSILVLILVLLFCVYVFINLINLDKCAYIRDPKLRDECYRDRAVEEDDGNICDKIENNETRENCLDCVSGVDEELEEQPGIITGGGAGDGGGSSDSEEPQGCEALSGERRDWCYRDKAVEETDPSICLEIYDNFYKDSCYRFIALDTKNSSYCNYMEDEDRRLWCKEALK